LPKITPINGSDLERGDNVMPGELGFEVDFLPVGDGDHSGDAIAIRYGTPGNYKVLAYDGGTKESGQQLVNHIKQYYGTSRVDYVVCSHPDADHASGLSVVLENMQVGELWMHQPWKYSSVVLDYFKDNRITDKSLEKRLKEEMSAAYELEQIAHTRRIPISEPFRGASIGGFVVLSPEQKWYTHDLIAEFQKSPAQTEAKTQSALGYQRGFLWTLTEAARTAASWIAERWDFETLREDVETSSENESSVVLYGVADGKGILLTGDAGVRALSATAEYAEANGISLPSILSFIQIPHHGSRRNVSTTVLDRIVGPRKAADDGVRAKAAYVSAGKESTTHPRKAVVNAFIRRGAWVVATQGQIKWYYYKMPQRQGWVPVTPLVFSEQVDAWD
jgi:beta-lactamase superfamily II metal-dependent hydrolase